MFNLKIVDYPGSLFFAEMPDHNSLKVKILDLIKSGPKISLEDKNQKISNTDFFSFSDIQTSFVRNLVEPFLNNYLVELSKLLDYNTNFLSFNNDLVVSNLWFQQYESNDFHNWHYHGNSIFSSVYFVELDQQSPLTEFYYFQKTFNVPIKEGTILTFPSFLIHRSKPNLSSRKTVISFNSKFSY